MSDTQTNWREKYRKYKEEADEVEWKTGLEELKEKIENGELDGDGRIDVEKIREEFGSEKGDTDGE
jgi:anti-sigma28 factor (negative regulator of flagellin synthesis)